jgi:uncharacterized LabA/DUF88 family protein
VFPELFAFLRFLSRRKERQERLADTRLKIAVFIDFDNIEIGVKSTLGVQFDVGVVLEALKERGDVVSKIAYGDWTRAGDYSRSLTQHATKLVQRNLTPGGDKNGADINLALDALEMAFTHSHINAYVIVGGDSDFITLVEKLKQYDKQIFVVGGRAFTSLVMQRNCHEFIAYENLVSSRRAPDRGRQPGTGAPVPVAQASLDQAVPLVRRALKVLADREVSPQLGLLKSTLLQLDSTFSERTYGAGSFRDFAQKLAAAGHVTLKEAGRNVLVELAEGQAARAEDTAPRPIPKDSAEPAAAAQPAQDQPQAPATAGPAGPPAMEPRVDEGVREVRRLFQSAQNPPRWPMYIRQAKQFLRNVEASFDERKFGFASLVDLMRACQREGLFRIERDRQGVMRIFPGNVMQAVSETVTIEPEEAEETLRADFQDQDDEEVNGNVEAVSEPVAEEWQPELGNLAEPEVVDGNVLQEMESPSEVVDGETEPVEASEPAGTTETAEAAEPAEQPESASRQRRSKPRPAPRAQGSRKTADTPSAPRARKTTSRPRTTSRSRTRKDTPSE